MTHRSILRLAAPMALVIGLASCGGETPTSSPGESAAAPSAEAPASQPAESAAASVLESAEASTPAIDIGGAAGSVSELSSYQLEMTVDDGTSGEQVMTILATSDPDATHYSMGDLELISVEGEGAWINQGGTWIAAPGGGDAFMSAFDQLAPDTLISAYGLGVYGSQFADAGTEERNGVETTRYHLDASDVPPGAEFPSDGSFDVWVANDGGYLVAMEFSGTDPNSGQEVAMSMEVSRVNDPSISIEPPI